ncbi:uncharacterized protein LOC108090000 isoform X2 [Drosophila ficusphila]|uniref:uncharacterized protein LOC108090000 isoform X2 n=1 Tax=Drosophila ficusphila TaxID=30025 RepID=UPI0007E65206|nr:uncharacterized protein LOC108090000 isoform X2 [Drosophila ficusphila]
MPKQKTQSRLVKTAAPVRVLRPVNPRKSATPPTPSYRTCIMDMPEDIIRLLYDHLPLLADKVMLACVEPKFRSVFEGWSKNRRIILEMESLETMPLPQLIRFFKVAGPFIKVLQVDCASFQKESLLVEFVSEFCPGLEEINYSNATDEFHYRTIMSKMTHLKKVTIDCLDAEDVLNFDLQSNQELESFELVNGCYTGKNLCGFPNLKNLVLRDCLLWNSGEFGIPLKSLITLDLDDCCFEFQITNEHARCLGQLSSLKDLRFSHNDVLEDDHFKFFNDLSQLEKFGLTWCGRVMDIGMMRMVRKCLLLRVIDLSDCEEITDEFVINAIGFCSKGPGRKLEINVKRTKIRQDILTNSDYLDPSNHVKVNFT